MAPQRRGMPGTAMRCSQVWASVSGKARAADGARSRSRLLLARAALLLDELLAEILLGGEGVVRAATKRDIGLAVLAAGRVRQKGACLLDEFHVLLARRELGSVALGL
jgi:hypothetical protein